MRRREALSALGAAAVGARARGGATLDGFFASAEGAAVLVDIAGQRVRAAHGAAAAAAQLVPPGSTVKPFVLGALLSTGRIAGGETLPCPAELTIAGRSFRCTHPKIAEPLGIAAALAYSCNCFVAHFAARFGPGELARVLERAGLGSRTGLLPGAEAAGRIRPAAEREAGLLQSLGEGGILVTACGLASAYRRLAISAGQPEMRPILEGLEGAVEFGTAQLAAGAGWQVAGKTGSVRTGAGARMAWFAGFAPSRAPRVVVVVASQGHSGGADAAPIAGRILEAYRAGRL